MKKDFVPYELAVKLKELGFDEEGLGMYSKNGSVLPLVPYTSEDKAILFSQAFRWFREKHGLQGYVSSTTVRGGKEGKHFSDYCWHINGIDMPFLSTDARDMENVSYEEAELACLTKLIEIVESQKEEK